MSKNLYLFDPDYPLHKWRRLLDELIEEYGEDAWMYCDSGPRGNCKLIVVIDGGREDDGE